MNVRLTHRRIKANNDILTARLEMRVRQLQGRFQYTPADPCSPEWSLSDKLAVLTEEVGEVAKEVLTINSHRLPRDGHKGHNPALYIELSQVAAVCLAWMESLLTEDGRTIPTF